MTRTLIFSLALLLGACASDTDAPAPEAEPALEEAADATSFGEGVPAGDARSAADLVAEADALNGTTVLVEGTVSEVCQMAGCWLSLGGAEGKALRIEVPRDESGVYVYTFPTDISGATARLAGRLAVETESVDDLRHYAEDGGASPEEIAAITEPRQTIVLTASGAELTDLPASDDAPEATDA
ncbi:MAG: DUF4920 domain-containing protein [Bacteroidota bacterium]